MSALIGLPDEKLKQKSMRKIKTIKSFLKPKIDPEFTIESGKEFQILTRRLVKKFLTRSDIYHRKFS
jgi:hypothetical protein